MTTQTDQDTARKLGAVMLHVVQPDPLTVSPGVAEAASSTRTQEDVRLQRLLRRGREYYAARDRYHAYEGDDEAEGERLEGLCSRAGDAFRVACEGYFLNAADRT